MKKDEAGTLAEDWRGSLDALNERILKIEDHLRERVGACYAEVKFEFFGAMPDEPPEHESQRWVLSWNRLVKQADDKQGWRMCAAREGDGPSILIVQPALVRRVGVMHIRDLIDTLYAEMAGRLEGVKAATRILDGMIEHYG